MELYIRHSLWMQFGAAIDMLEGALHACPDSLWRSILWKDAEGEDEYSEYWYRVYHTLFYIDLYLSESEADFAPPPPFKREGFPEQPYTKGQLQAYFEHCREKCRKTIMGLTDEQARQVCGFYWLKGLNFYELQLYNMRHVQEHAAQLNLWLGQHGVEAQGWVAQAGG